MGTNALAALYTRISQDASGEGLGVARQEEDCRALADRLGLTVVEVYTDNDVSGSRYSRKVRHEYRRMLADAREGKFGTIIAYSNSRLTRRLADLEELITLYEQHGTVINTVVSGNDDLSTADGRMVARIKASVDMGESERVSERVQRKHREKVLAGQVVGGGNRPFGYEPDQVTVRESEAMLIREAAAAVLDGAKIGTIVKQWNADGVVTSKGNPWTGGLLLQLLRSPRLAGWRVHRPSGTKWSAIPPIATDDTGRKIRGEWTPILDEETHERLAALLTARKDVRGVVPRRNARRYLGTGLLRCTECRGPMYANRVKDSHYYRCDTVGCTNSASGRGVDQWIRDRVVGWSEVIEPIAMSQPRDDAAAVAETVADLAEQIADGYDLIDELMASMKKRQITPEFALAQVGDLQRTIAEWEEQKASLVATSPPPLEVTEEGWEEMDVDERRAATERLLDVLWIEPAKKRGNQFDESRIHAAWRVR